MSLCPMAGWSLTLQCQGCGVSTPLSPVMQESKFFEESFQVYERGIALFKWPHVSDIWQAYLSQFVERYKGTKLERARDLYKQALESVS